MNHMQRQFITTTLDLLEEDPRTVLLFAGAGIVDQSSFEDFKYKKPDRIIDLGISEQAAIGFASGLAVAEKIPIFHTQAPFLIERAFEQLKIDFGYQNIGGNFIGMGGSIEYTFLGPTHHCPADIGVLKLIPNMQIVVPGSVSEFDNLYRNAYSNNSPTYYRLARNHNKTDQDVKFGKASVVRKGKKATIIAVGPMLQLALDYFSDEDITILYYTTLSPFDKDTLIENLVNDRLLLLEPYYSGALLEDIISSIGFNDIKISTIGYPMKFYSKYGLTSEYDTEIGFSGENFMSKLNGLIL
mgnify:CR=1 FL=1